jgi:predicted nuclease with RNAse H fold
VRYCGIAVGERWQQLCALEEVRLPEPPIRLAATFYEPGSVEQVVAQLHALEEVVVAVAAPLSRARGADALRACDAELRRRGVPPVPPLDAGRALAGRLEALGLFRPDGDGPAGQVADGAFRTALVFETNADGVFCTLQGRRVPARRHPHGIQLRIQELIDDHVDDAGGSLWGRRIEEIDAAAAALCAHRYAVGHASWVGDPDEGVIVLPGTSLPESFSAEGVLPPVARVPLPDV